MILTIEIPDEEAGTLRQKAAQIGVPDHVYAEQVLRRDLQADSVKQSVSMRVRELWRDMPEDVRAKLPVDGASQIDHYLYGHPKREQ